MANSDWHRIEELFEQAVELPIEERSAFLARRCGADDALRCRVESLLANDADARVDFLERPAAGPRFKYRADAPDPLVGRTVGAYTIREVIARGGMGTVYRAEQASPRRDVALKVLSTSLWSASAERRFEFESQILARLQHPNIAQVYEAGTAHVAADVPVGRDRPTRRSDATPDVPTIRVQYFAMEYVPNARTIIRYADEFNLNTRQRLELFLRVCDAVHYGHQKGIIHRDLKPGNILVGGEFVAADLRVGRGRPAGTPDATVKIIDFGVARCVDSDVALTTMHTDTGQLIGTLAYMSPEQCDADPLGLDVRSDVYSLGVVLYELICGRLPYEVSTTNVYAATQAIKQAQPARPSRVTRSGRHPGRPGHHPKSDDVRHGGRTLRIKGDLETIVLKVLEKDRARRYQSAADLADDTRRYLRREPIAARPPTAWTNAIRWSATHPMAVTVITCVCIAVTALASVFSAVWWLNSRPDRIVIDYEQNWKGEPLIRAVRLIARDHRTLYTWPNQPRSGHQQVNAARLVDEAVDWNGDRLAIIGFSNSVSEKEVRGKLAAFEIDPLPPQRTWLAEVMDEDLPPNVRGNPRRSANASHPTHVNVADVFEETHGPELIAVFTLGEFSQQCLRIYDLRGNRLFQIWQDGGITDTLWLSESGLLVCTGLDETAKDRLRTTHELKEPLAPVVFAVCPRRGVSTVDYITMERADDPVNARWYRFLSVISTADRRVTLKLSRPHWGGSRATVDLLAQFVVGNSTGGVHFVLDEGGNELPDGRMIDDAYRALRTAFPALVPDAGEIRLQDAPPTADWAAN